jgi:hypothetical protein
MVFVISLVSFFPMRLLNNQYRNKNQSAKFAIFLVRFQRFQSATSNPKAAP